VPPLLSFSGCNRFVDSPDVWALTLFAVLTVLPEIEGAPAPVIAVEPPVEQQALPVLPDAPVAVTPPLSVPEPAEVVHPICRVGLIVMIPDGREARVTSHGEGICRVLAYGEGYTSLWHEDIVEPVYPQYLPHAVMGH
jgi:hypothetical protein